MPEADCNGDHVPGVTDMELQLKRPKKRRMKQNINNKLLKSDDRNKDLYSGCVSNKFATFRGEVEIKSMETEYGSLRIVIEEAIKRLLITNTVRH